ncbi:hypothetical protein BB559_001665 [Furculomyces boomerangus]|uniref:Ribosomal protein n=2 Tax=Harpellales TaxID=61421 RepID=A0A2T9Z154_9FUNG|nr:hypothetical protein BB559_001665 [Furculomyces boomerangus]PWA00494.1 hypothetical protein BB558_003455 [Smittium angustum]
MQRFITLQKVFSVKTPKLTRNYATKKKKIDEYADYVDLNSALRAYEIGNESSVVELHIQCKPEKGQHPIRGNFLMPNPVKSDVFLVVFAEGKQALEAKEAGADVVGCQEVIEKIKNGELKFDKCIATPEVLPQVAKIARILGPKGLMPTVNKGNVTDDVKNAVLYAKKSFEFKADKQFVVHSGVAKIVNSDNQIKENISAFMDALKLHAKSGKKKFIGSVYLSSTRGPGIPVLLD